MFFLIVFRSQLKICLRMRADGAHVGRFFADDDMPAVGALPDGVAVLAEYQVVFHVG